MMHPQQDLSSANVTLSSCALSLVGLLALYIESVQGATPRASSTQLTRPSLFVLLTSLALANAYQPASGSFVFSPSSRFWRGSPISSLADLCMLVRRVLVALPKCVKSSYDVATQVDANLTDAHLAFTVGATGEEGNQPSEERRSDDIPLEDEEAFDLGTGPYQEACDGNVQNRPAAYDPETTRVESGWLQNALERIRLFIYMFWNHILMQSYCLVIARAMNASTGLGKYLELRNSRDDLRRRHECYQSTLREMHESWRFRLGTGLPTVAQYVKIMVVRGITIPKVLASIYFCHWLILEILLTLAIFCKRDYLELTRLVDAYLSKTYLRTADLVEQSESSRPDPDGDGDGPVEYEDENEDASWDEIRKDEAKVRIEIQRWPYDENENVVMYIHLCVFIFVLQIPASGQASLIRGLASMPICFATLTALHLKRYVLIQGSRKTFEFDFGFLRWGKREKPTRTRSRRRMNGPTFGGYAVGGDLGLACLGIWALWCILFFAVEGTSRPDWPWLDFLG